MSDFIPQDGIGEPSDAGSFSIEEAAAWDPWSSESYARGYENLCLLMRVARGFARVVRDNVASATIQAGGATRRPDLPGFPRDVAADEVVGSAKVVAEVLRDGFYQTGIYDFVSRLHYFWFADLYSYLMERWGWGDIDLCEDVIPADAPARRRSAYGRGGETIDSEAMDALEAAVAGLERSAEQARTIFGEWPWERRDRLNPSPFSSRRGELHAAPTASEGTTPDQTEGEPSPPTPGDRQGDAPGPRLTKEAMIIGYFYASDGAMPNEEIARLTQSHPGTVSRALKGIRESYRGMNAQDIPRGAKGRGGDIEACS